MGTLDGERDQYLWIQACSHGEVPLQGLSLNEKVLVSFGVAVDTGNLDDLPWSSLHKLGSDQGDGASRVKE